MIGDFRSDLIEFPKELKVSLRRGEEAVISAEVNRSSELAESSIEISAKEQRSSFVEQESSENASQATEPRKKAPVPPTSPTPRIIITTPTKETESTRKPVDERKSSSLSRSE